MKSYSFAHIIELLTIISSANGMGLRVMNGTAYASPEIVPAAIEDIVPAADPIEKNPYNMTDFTFLEVPEKAYYSPEIPEAVTLNSTFSETTPLPPLAEVDTPLPPLSEVEKDPKDEKVDNGKGDKKDSKGNKGVGYAVEQPSTPKPTEVVAGASSEKVIGGVNEAAPVSPSGGCGAGCIAASVVVPVVVIAAVIGAALFIKRRRRRRSAEYDASFDPVF